MTRTLMDVVSGSRPIPFTESEIRTAMEAVKVRRGKGSDLSIGHKKFGEGGAGVMKAAQEGLLFFHSPMLLKSAFLFVKLDAGRGLLGGQKAVFGSYIATDLEADEWEVGTVFKMWGIAVTSIGNIYRAYGYA